jgi:hypothetical protein
LYLVDLLSTMVVFPVGKVGLLLEIGLRGGLFCLLATIGLRVATPLSMAEAVDVAPASVRRVVRKILRLRAVDRSAFAPVKQPQRDEAGSAEPPMTL